MGYLSITDADREAMLAVIGVSSVDELFEQIPEGVRFERELDVPSALTEVELTAHVTELAARNAHGGVELSFLGAGMYDHYVPACVDVLRGQKEEGPAEKLVAFVMEEKAIPRTGMGIEEGGEVTSGSLSPMLDVGIGLAYVRAELAAPETRLTVDARGRARRARVVKKPIYHREGD